MKSLVQKKEVVKRKEAQCCAKNSRTAVGCHD